MSEEKDEATMAEEQAHLEAGHHGGGVEELEGVPPQINATPGMPFRKAVKRRQDRVRQNLHLLPKNAQQAILESLGDDPGKARGDDPDDDDHDDRDDRDDRGRHHGRSDDDARTESIPAQQQ
jgi:phospholipid/cholesterol/gamma-HCH transport system ATP-binding protein